MKGKSWLKRQKKEVKILGFFIILCLVPLWIVPALCYFGYRMIECVVDESPDNDPVISAMFDW